MQSHAFSYANLSNAALLEQLFEAYQKEPGSVDPTWQYFFSGMEFASKADLKSSHEPVSGDLSVYRLIWAYRTFGHKKASFSPLEDKSASFPELELSNFGLNSSDLQTPVSTFGLLSSDKAPLSSVVERLEEIYAGSCGYEFQGLMEEEQNWLISQVESSADPVSQEEQKEILLQLGKTEFFERFMHRKYPGQTRFSLEGGETFIPLINELLRSGALQGLTETTIGMAHRGRLNVIAHVLQKSYEEVFKEFEDMSEDGGSSDVKYHKGFSQDVTVGGKTVFLELCPNPSHLESVDPVAEGVVRARQDARASSDAESQSLALLVHGDASISGQGVVYEVMQMSRLEGYKTGGTVHVVFNNYIGYTTQAEESRSTLYCTDIAKAFGAPVIHVHSEDPIRCMQAARLAMKYRQTFHKDIFIDLGCYRKHGHNEGDEPTFTQPVEYQKIKEKKTIYTLFKDDLLKQGALEANEVRDIEKGFELALKQASDSVLEEKKSWQRKESQPLSAEVKAQVPLVDEKTLRNYAQKLFSFPEGFHMHPKLEKIITARLSLETMDWATAEQLLFASLVEENIPVRLSGQDAQRGTFSHRHAIWTHQKTSEKYCPLQNMSNEQAPFRAYNSPLSEYGVLGFDLGYSLPWNRSLVVWEAQYGDFFNGAQIIIDQYLSSSEQKWGQSTNLTLLLPHGYEGKGPEHSSARIERFLQLSAEGNWTVANCTTPAQYYHLMRRQAYAEPKKPLILFAPKVLLRNPACVSSVSELSQGGFQPVLVESEPPKEPKRVIFCSGKVFYDLVQEKTQRGASGTLIIRLEQLYPFPQNEIIEALKPYTGLEKVLWVQEEHKNMGAFFYIEPQLEKTLEMSIEYAGRAERASPAAGSYGLHKSEYETFMQTAFKDGKAKGA